MNPTDLRRAAIAAINAFFDVLEAAPVDGRPTSTGDFAPSPSRATSSTRRAPTHPPAVPLGPVSDVDRAAARKVLKRMGVKRKPKEDP